MTDSIETSELEAKQEATKAKPEVDRIMDSAWRRAKLIQDARFAVNHKDVLHTPAMHREIIAGLLDLVEGGAT